jgi:nitronate monooxygenase
VGSLGEARAAADAGCDLLALQGIEAGGHIRGHSALLPLLESVLGQLDLPVLAAGGLGDARAFAAVLAAGADGARVGTRFVATSESGAHADYKQAVADAAADSTEITGAFSVCPLCATVPRARVLRSCIDALRDLADDTVGERRWAASACPCPKVTGSRQARAPPATSARCPCTRASRLRPSPPSNRWRRSSNPGAPPSNAGGSR